MARKLTKAQQDSHSAVFTEFDARQLVGDRDKWLSYMPELDWFTVKTVQTVMRDVTRGAWAQCQWLWELLEPADPILSLCVGRRESALKTIPWQLQIKNDLSDAQTIIAEAQLRTLDDFFATITNIDEAIGALGSAAFRHFKFVQLLEHSDGTHELAPLDSWNFCQDGYRGKWQWNPKAAYGITKAEDLPIDWDHLMLRTCPRPIDQPAMMLALDRRNAKAQWYTYNGRFGVPPIFAILPSTITDGQKAAYLEMVKRTVSNSAGVLPAGSDVKLVQASTGSPDTFTRALDTATSEMILLSTGGLLTSLTAPGAGTNTSTGNAHQEAFDLLAKQDADEIANLFNQSLVIPLLNQWHPGQDVLVEFALEKPSADETKNVDNITKLTQSGYRVSEDQVSEMTGYDIVSGTDFSPTAIYAAKAAGYVPTLQEKQNRTGMDMTVAPELDAAAQLNSLRIRYAPTMLYPPARRAFEDSINNRTAQINTAKPQAPKLSDEEIALLIKLADLQPSDQRANALAEAMERQTLDALNLPDNDAETNETGVDSQNDQTSPAKPLQNANKGDDDTTDDNEDTADTNYGTPDGARKGWQTRGKGNAGRKIKRTTQGGGQTGRQTGKKTDTSNPYQTRSKAKAGEKIKATTKSLKKVTKKGGVVEDVTKVGKDNLRVDGRGALHMKHRHGEVPPKDVSKAIHTGKSLTDPHKEKGGHIKYDGKTRVTMGKKIKKRLSKKRTRPYGARYEKGL